MMDDLVFPAMFFCGVLILALLGVIHLSMDFRHYDEIQKQCQKQGFIQNKTTRITCKVE